MDKAITTLVFDLDDTLYDEIDYCRSGFSAVAGALADSVNSADYQQLFGAFWNQFQAGNRTKTFNAALDQLGIKYDDEFIQKLVKIYRGHTPSITLPTESRNALNELKSKYTLALLTDGFLPAQQLKVKALGIEKYFRSIVYTEQLGREYWKPSPAGFQKIVEMLNVKPQNCVYIADNEEKDFIAPNKLGFLTIQIIRACRIHTHTSAEPGAAAAHTITSICQLFSLLEGL